jgi:hypothetical protein
MSVRSGIPKSSVASYFPDFVSWEGTFIYNVRRYRPLLACESVALSFCLCHWVISLSYFLSYSWDIMNWCLRYFWVISELFTELFSMVHVVHSDVGWIVGRASRLLQTTDGTNSWQVQSSGETGPVDWHGVRYETVATSYSRLRWQWHAFAPTCLLQGADAQPINYVRRSNVQPGDHGWSTNHAQAFSPWSAQCTPLLLNVAQLK